MDNLAHGVAHYCLTAIGGVAAQGYSLTADGLRGSRTLTLSSSGIGSLGVAAGDVIWVQSEAQALNIAGHKKADLYFVLAVADTTITVAGDLLDSYLVADSASVWKVAPRSHVQIEDLAITAAAYASSPTTPLSPLISLQLAVDCSVRNVRLYRNNGAGVEIRSSLDCRVSDSEIEDLRDDPVSVPSVLGYGVVLEAATRGCAVVGNTIRRCRHGITTGTAAYWSKPNYGVPRGLAITGNTVSDCTGAAIDTHGDVDGITITGNAISGTGYNGPGVGSNDGSIGIQIRGLNAAVTGNTIHGAHGYGIYVRPTAQHVTIVANIVRATALDEAGAAGHGICICGKNVSVTGNHVTASATHGVAIDGSASQDVNLTGNTINDNGQNGGVGAGIWVNTNIIRLVIVGNTVADTQTKKTQQYGLRIESAFTDTSGRNIVQANIFEGVTARVSNAGSGKLDMMPNGPQPGVGRTQVVNGLTTGPVGAGATVDLTVIWPQTFGDTAYGAFASLTDSSNALTILTVKSKAAASCVVSVKNTGSSARTGTIDVVGIHS